jgi:phosphoglycerate dehydrogenase-like enzyme
MHVVFYGTSAAGFHAPVTAALAKDWTAASILPGDKQAAAELARADAIVASVFKRGAPPTPKLKLLQVGGAGYDAIEIDALPKGVTLCNVFEHEASVAEYALLAMLEWSHRLGEANSAVRAGDWSRASKFSGPPDEEIAGKTLAIVGLGRIGRAVAKRAKACDMRVIAANRTPSVSDPNVERVYPLTALTEAVAAADFVVLACALTPDTKGLIGTNVLAAMKPNAVIVNVARGPVIDEAALAAALAARKIGGAVIDVWWHYPEKAKDAAFLGTTKLKGLDNVLLSPHVAGWSTGTLARRARFVAAQLGRLARGEALQNIVLVRE